MSDSEDLFELYRTDRPTKAAPIGEALAAALADNLRKTLSLMERLIQEVAQALSQARYTIRLSPVLVDRATYIRLDRSSESFRDYLRNWSHQRAAGAAGGLHWEAQVVVTDHRRSSAEIRLGLTIEWPTGQPDAGIAFVEFWTTGQGAALPDGSRDFQRALVASIIRLEEAGTLTSAKRRA